MIQGQQASVDAATQLAESNYDLASEEANAYITAEQQARQQADSAAGNLAGNLAVAAQEALANEGINVRVVSMPSMDLFEKQSKEYRESVLPKSVTKRMSIEMGATYGWHKYVGFDGVVLGIDRFGASAPANQVIEAYGFTVENVVSLYKGM